MRGFDMATCSYDRIYLIRAQSTLGCMLDYATYDLKQDFSQFYDFFLASGIAKDFGLGDFRVIAGHSGIELALEVLGINEDTSYRPVANRSPEYWTGWALAYFQWQSGLSFKRINEAITIDEVRQMYHPYHEMDVTSFADHMQNLFSQRSSLTNLKRLRQKAGLSQRELANGTGVPVRTIQQYEQRQKDINAAKAETIFKIQRFLHCEAEDLLEL